MSTPFGITGNIALVVCKDAQDAINMGYDYSKGGYLPAQILKAVIVQDGTESGRPTVDIIFEDQNGVRYVGMITGRLLHMVDSAMRGLE